MPRAALGDLLLAFAFADGLIAAGVLLAGHQAWLAPVALAAAVAAVVLDRQGRRPAAAGVLIAGAFLLPETVLLLSRAPEAPVQDGLLITDAAAGRLLHGADPYGHDYIDSAPLRAFWLPELPVNPLLGHYVYPPGMILLALPLRAAGLTAAWLWLPGLAALAGAAWFAARWAGVLAAALSPLLLLDYLYLFNDLFALTAALLAFGFLIRRRALAAGLAVGAALCLKQTALVFVPPLLLVAAGNGRRQTALLAAGACGLLALAVLPFIAASPRAFLADTAAYFYGAGVDSFPIRGPGLPGLLLDAGLIPSRWAAYPAAAVQAVAGAVVLAAGWRWLGRFSWARLWLWTAAIAGVLFLLGRTLAPNYVTLLAILLLLAWTSALEDGAPGEPAVDRIQDRTASDPGVENPTG